MRSPTLPERVLAHLHAHPVAADAADVAPGVTQQGIADALGARVAHVSRALSQLRGQGLVGAHMAHARGGTRRCRAHWLTVAGHAPAKDAAALVMSQPQSPRAPPTPRVPPLIGRDESINTLREAANAALGGEARVVLLEGEAGAGKTRLLDAFEPEAEKSGFHVMRGRSGPTGDTPRLGPLAAMLAPHGFDAADLAGERASEAARAALERAAAVGPVALLLDDLHLAGPRVVEWVHGLIRQAPPGRAILFVLSFRQEEAWAPPTGPLYKALIPLRALPLARLVTLPRLTPAQTARMLRAAGHEGLPANHLARIALESGGNPYYALAMADAAYDDDPANDFFPDAVATSMNARLSELDPESESLLELIAVAGPAMPYPRLRDAAGFEDEARLVAALDDVLDRLLLEEDPAGRDELRVRFTHPKVREAVLAGLSGPKRRLLENRVAGR